MVTVMVSLVMALLGAWSAAPVAAAVHTGGYEEVTISTTVA